MSDANRSALYQIAESDFGVTPATPAFGAIRFKGESLAHVKETIQSQEIRPDGNVADLAEVGANAAGDINFELSAGGSWDWLIAAALMASGAITVNEASVPLSVDLATQKITKADVRAIATLTSTGVIPTDGDTVDVNGHEYTARTALTLSTTADEVLIGGSAAQFLANLKAAVNGGAGSGTAYGSDTVAHATVDATTLTATTLVFRAKTGGTGGNAYTSTELAATLSFGAGVFSGGAASTWAVQPVPGQWVKVSGFATAANNGFKRVVSGGDTNDIIFAAGSFTADETYVTASVKGVAYVNGMTPQYHTIERVVPVASGALYQAYSGMTVDELSIELASKQITTGVAKFMGKVGDSRDAAIAGATYGSPTTTKVLNGTRHVGSLIRDGAALTEKIRNLSFMIKRNVRAKDALANFGPWDVGLGKCEITGKFSAYFETKDVLDDFLAHNYTSIGALQQDAAGNAIGFFVPEAAYATGNPAVTGENTDIYQEVTFQGIYNAASGGSIVVSIITP